MVAHARRRIIASNVPAATGEKIGGKLAKPIVSPV
jgi:hypothetical protein